ncbi:unnamed protein product [Rotaria socialis]|uniref:Uncharacterized protein n=1 Tax=Rotaria socialis TaxID=392032 RepID=A0A821WHQ5_9BILA|nr:unnamed protein product [Rotaria socialis]CAF3502610.1 unnamed protein product [Rotaria socialis]CAF3615019.1 unnamed protein product [Rotaria socialis]CAF4478512.1 unnamed protein product [Rotaria socialis]CAF4485732.1 unnamed protein product [Rotaria socialis]
MFHNEQTAHEQDYISLSSSQHTTDSSPFFQSSPYFTDYRYYSSNMIPNSHNSLVLPSNGSRVNSHLVNWRIFHSIFSHDQPIMNPHEHLSSRTVKNSPQHLTRRQKTHCLKAGQKAQYNQQLLFNFKSSSLA